MVSNFLNNSSPQLEKNEKILTILKEHQKTTLYACNFLESNKIKKNGLEATSKIGILCDKVGSGKSLSILSLIAHNPILEEDRYMCIKTTKNSMVSIFKGTSLNDFDYLKINVIVVPHSIASQWINYIKNDTKIKFTTINSKKTFNSLLECNDSVSPSFSNSHKINIKYKLEQYDVLLVISTKYKQTSEYLNNFGFTVSRLIFDEADSINIPACKPIKNIMLWFVTSNRKTILNPRGSILYQNPETGQLNSWYSYSNNFTKRVQEQGIRCRGFIKDACESLFEIQEDIRELLFISNENEFIKQSFLLEKPHLYTIICKDPPMLSVLNNIVSNTTMDHIKAGDIEGAILTINCTKIDGKNLINLVTEDLKNELHNKFIEYESKSKMIYSSEKIKKESLDKIKDKIKDLENKISQINKKISDDDTCPICYDNIENVTLCKHCNNKFCLKCITSWMMSQTQCKCPYCRGIITNESLILVTDNIEKKTDKEKLKSKNENVKIILEKIGNNSKILIFSKYDGSFSEISEMCNNNSIKYDKIMGSSVKIDNTIKKFNLPNSDPNSIDVLLLNSRYCGSGLNLQNATDIIIYHNMEQDLMNQIIGRAQRPGRTNKLNIWSLCYSNESNNSNILSIF
jgi:SNF2 family DNA or RNA helicase